MLNNPLKYIDPTGHFEHDAIKAYLQGAHPETWEAIWKAWLQDSAWMDMLYQAGAGDVGCYLGADGSANWFKFTGYMKEKLTGAELIPWPTDTETGINIALNNIQSGILGSRVSGLLQNSDEGWSVRETLPYDLGGHYIELFDYHRVDSSGGALINDYGRAAVLMGIGAGIGAVSPIPGGSWIGAVIGAFIDATLDHFTPNWGTSVGDEQVRLRFSLSTSNPGYSRAATSGGASTVRSYWMRPRSYGTW